VVLVVARISLGAKFCNKCATPLKGVVHPAVVPTKAPLSYTPRHLAGKILTSRSALEGERKQVTISFADAKGSMELIEDLDPEDARPIIHPAPS
jgi:class 3 adenylate cyclase